MHKPILLLFLIPILFYSCTNEETRFRGFDLSENVWNLWLDEKADWENDSLYLPPVNLKTLPVNEPTCGWDSLYLKNEKRISLPATVEQHYWGKNGNSFGISGDYSGVSWFTTKIDIPEFIEGKRISLEFESVRLRAEVYVNEKIAGYHLINGTPFSVDITEFVNYGTDNSIAVRITDPNGNFAWRDWETYKWGSYDIPPSHGFGGITGKVKLIATDKIYIEDIFIKNKPGIKSVDVIISLKNTSNESAGGNLSAEIIEKSTGKILGTVKKSIYKFENEIVSQFSFESSEAKEWSVDSPFLYTLRSNWEGDDGSNDEKYEDFGFRWFEVRNIDGDRQFFLNNKRIVLRSAISWGHWPINGIFPTDELAKKQIETAKSLGLNTLNFHRGIGQTSVLEYADELGLLYYEEPGGYAPGQSEFTRAFKREKLLRMIKRDRNHPSVIIYNMINEAGMTLGWENRLDPWPNEKNDIIEAHKLDETRIITYTSTFFSPRFHDRKCPQGKAAFKMHLLPYDHELKYDHWWDEHHAGGPGVYRDDFYNSPDDMHRHYEIPQEIILLGEDGAIGTPHRLERIYYELKNNQLGWDGQSYINQYTAFDNFLNKYDFNSAFPNVDKLTQSLGAVSYYYQGRIIENFRIGNTGDGYIVNGWEGGKIENHSGIVDIFRNPKSDPKILAYYNQPLYLAVKNRNKVVEVGDKIISDFYIVNELDLKGNYKLLVKIDGRTTFESDVQVSGGNNYGELLAEGIATKIDKKGYTRIEAELYDGKEIKAKGIDEIFAAEIDIGSLPVFAVRDTSGEMQELIESINPKIKFSENTGGIPNEKIMLLGGSLQPGIVKGNFRLNDPTLDWVTRGNNLLIIKNAELWAEYLNIKEVIDYRGYKNIDRNWFGGNYFVREHSFFNDLPVNNAFNWEYQSLAKYGQLKRIGLRLKGDECIVGCYADHNHEVYSALSIINVGRGKIVLCALDIENAIKTSGKSGIVAKKILINILSNL